MLFRSGAAGQLNAADGKLAAVVHDRCHLPGAVLRPGDHILVSSCLPCGISIPKIFTYALYFVIAFELEVIYLAIT